MVVKQVLVFSSSEVLVFSSSSDVVGDVRLHLFRVLVVRSVSKSGGLVHVRNRYNTESVFVLEHAGTPNPTSTEHIFVHTCIFFHV